KAAIVWLHATGSRPSAEPTSARDKLGQRPPERNRLTASFLDGRDSSPGTLQMRRPGRLPNRANVLQTALPDATGLSTRQACQRRTQENVPVNGLSRIARSISTHLCQMVERRLGSAGYNGAIIVLGAGCNLAATIELKDCGCSAPKRQVRGF